MHEQQARRMEHHRLVARQGGIPFPLPGGDDTPGPSSPPAEPPAASEPPTQPSNPPSQPPPSPSQPPPSPSQPPSQPPPSQPTPTTSSTTPPPPSSTTSDEPDATSSTTSSSSSSARSSSSSARTSSRSSSSSSSRATTSPTTRAANRQTATSSFGRASGISVAPGVQTTNTSTIDPSAADSNAPVGAVSTGAIVGGVAGGLAALAAIIVIVMFLLRKMRKRREAAVDFNDEDFGNDADFNRNAFVQSPQTPSMMQAHSVSPSVSGPGMAGQGAYASAGAAGGGYGGYGATDASGAALGGAAAAGGLQERPKYVYGQDVTQDDDQISDHAHGAYSSQPQPMQVGYGSDPFGAANYGGYQAQGTYAAYDAQGAQTGYAQATREYQGQEGYAVTAEGGYQGYNDQQQQYAQGYAAQGYDNGQYAAQGYDAQHPYAQAYDPSQYANGQTPPAPQQSTKKAAGNDDAYGGM